MADALMKEFPMMDRMMAETLVLAEKNGWLDNIDVSTAKPHSGAMEIKISPPEKCADKSANCSLSTAI